MRRLILPLIAVLALAGCGGGDGPAADAGSSGDPASAIPADVAVVIKLAADLDGDQWGSALAFADRVDNSDQDLRAALEEELETDDFTYANDIEPWLGDEVALGLESVGGGDLEGVIVAQTDDEDAASAALRKGVDQPEEAVYEDVEYFVDGDGNATGVTDGLVIAGSDETNFKAAVDALRGDSLSDDEDYRQTAELAPDDSFASAYVDAQGLLTLLEQSGAVPPATLDAIRSTPGFDASGSALASVVAEDDAMTLEIAGQAVPAAEGDAPALADLPGDAWLAAAAAVSGDTFAEGFQSGFEASGGAEATAVLKRTGLVDYLSTVTSFALRAGGTTITGLNGELTLGGGDADAALVTRIARTVNKFAGGPLFAIDGATATLNQPPFQLTLAAADGDLELRLGEAPGQPLADDESFTSAVDRLDMDDAALFVDFAPLEELVRTLPGADTDEALPVLAELGALVAGFETDGDASRARVVLTLR